MFKKSADMLPLYNVILSKVKIYFCRAILSAVGALCGRHYSFWHPTRRKLMTSAGVWDTIYATGQSSYKPIVTEPSSFARSVHPLLCADRSLLELGCGNGRDAAFFSSIGLHVHGIDISEVGIAKCRELCPEATFAVQNFVNLPTPLDSMHMSFDVVYSRFTLHSVKEEECSRALRWTFENLVPGGLFLIEVRSVLDAMCGVGMQVLDERNAWINGHYRRFIEKEELLKELRAIGFQVQFEQEEKGLSPYGDDDPVLIRLHLQRP